MPLAALKGWTREQKHVVAASYLGWTLDAFDFFLLVFVVTDIAKEFGVAVPAVLFAITLTLAFRPVGAFILGRLADRYGRRPVLMLDVMLYAVLAFASAFSPNLIVFLILRSLFGMAMGGEWGIGASLTMESVRPESRGVVSGILQSGYASGYLIASVAYGFLFPVFGWRGLFMVGILPAFLILYIRRSVPESPAWNRERATRSNVIDVLGRHWKLALYAILLMTCFNFLSHGTQDVYPTFLKVDHGLKPHQVSVILVIANIGAIIGGLTFGTLSQHFGRRRVMIAAALLCLPVLPLWAFSQDLVLLTVGAFLMQVMVQGCWGLVPAHLNELSPSEVRGTFPGVVYQLGNFLASSNAWLQGMLAIYLGTYAWSLAAVCAVAAIMLVFFASIGQEAKDVDMRVAAAAE
jgi:SHS family lactate transporter-like MFS transporter